MSAAGLLFFYKGLEAGKTSIIIPIASSWSIISVLVGVFLLSESLSAVQLVGIPLVVIGTVLASFKAGEDSKGKANGLAGGIPYVLLAVGSWGFMFPIIGVLSKSLGWLWPVFFTSVGSAAILFAYASINKIDVSFPRDITARFGVYSAANSAAFLLYSIASGYGSIAIVSTIVAADPLMVLVLAYVIMHERLRRNQVLGILIILFGIVAIAI